MRTLKISGMDSTPNSSSAQLFGLTDAKRRSIRRWVFGGMTLLMLVGVGIGFVPYYAASREMQRFCASLVTGSPLADAQAQAAARGYDVVPDGEGRMLLKLPQLAPQVPSKRGCELRVGPTGMVVSSAYSDSL